MASESIKLDKNLTKFIKNRRLELNLTIEEAAKRAGVGIKTWCRYESGQAIRKDKYKGVCRALNCNKLTTDDFENNEIFEINIDEYKKDKKWSKWLEDNYGENAAISFIAGIELLSDYINQDLEELSSMPKGTHLGEISCSFLKDYLPKQFLMNYDYNFVYAMNAEILKFVKKAECNKQIIAHSVLGEIVLSLVGELAISFFEETKIEVDKEWVYEIFDDSDIDFYLDSNIYITEDNIYHFSHWLEEQFFVD